MSQSLPIYQVSQLANEMQRLLEASYPEIWIEGELSSLSKPASGHLYFSLKDDQAQLRCAMFRNRAASNRYQPKTGDLVRVRAKISMYSARGDLQCIVQYMEDAGEGMLQRRFEELKEKLNKRGLFDAAHKQRLPEFPRHIGLITSPTGAAVKDVLTTLARRCPSIPVTLYPAVVQGDGAAKTLIQAIHDAVRHQRCDVIIITRGGGSLEDLWCFNDEQLAEAIFHCPIPIVCAVGHEIDVTIADFVADLRAPTPTAAAELLSPDNARLRRDMGSLTQRLRQSFSRYLEKQAQRVDLSYQRLQHPKSAIRHNQTQLAHAGKRLQRAIDSCLFNSAAGIKHYSLRLRAQPPQRRIQQEMKNLRTLSDRARRAQSQSLSHQHRIIAALGSELQMVSPLATLDRGYSITRDQTDSIIRDSKATQSGDTVKVQLKKGSLKCEVQEVQE